jgi:hypothetical protein
VHPLHCEHPLKLVSSHHASLPTIKRAGLSFAALAKAILNIKTRRTEARITLLPIIYYRRPHLKKYACSMKMIKNLLLIMNENKRP